MVALWGVLFGLVVSGVLAWQWWPRECGWSSGIRLSDKVDGECIGITDGSYLFNDPNNATNNNDRTAMERINDVQKRIKAENDTASGADRYVKVVLLAPLTVSRARPPATSLRHILHSLEGAYTALRRANYTSSFGDPSAVKIQLLLANGGSRQNADPGFLDDILKVSQSDHPVVAVIGMGVSVLNTETAAKYLANKGIPMVSALASADSLSNLRLLWSVSPSNTEYANQLKSFLDQQGTLRSGIIVYDRNPDLFTQSLAQAYRDQLGRYVTFPDQPFQGSTLAPQNDNQQPVPNVFLPVVANLCNAANDPRAPLDVVFYGGRVADFSAFATALEARARGRRNAEFSARGWPSHRSVCLDPPDQLGEVISAVSIAFSRVCSPPAVPLAWPLAPRCRIWRCAPW